MNDFPYYVTVFKSVKYYSMFVVPGRMCQTWIHMSSQCVDWCPSFLVYFSSCWFIASFMYFYKCNFLGML